MAGNSTLKILLIAAAAAAGVMAAPVRTVAAIPPELAQLKRAAEAGSAIAQFNYGQRVANEKEQLAWLARSAGQGFTLAQDALGAHFDRAFLFDPKKKPALIREAVRWTSRAAYQGFPPAQVRLSKFFETGAGVGRDPVIAAMWIQLAIDNPKTSFGERMMASMNRDALLAHTSPDNLAEGQRLAAEFTYPRATLLNPIEERLLVAGLTLTEIYRHNENVSAEVNHELIRPGETKDITLDEHSVSLTCIAIGAASARFRVTGTETEITVEQKK